jgi:asparagine N-glycosylation enzyme membrane subunit Stt3
MIESWIFFIIAFVYGSMILSAIVVSKFLDYLEKRRKKK